MTITKITDHVGEAVAQLPEQWKEKPKTVAFLSALVRPWQGVEDAFWQLLVERTLDAAIGAQLDRLGARVGQSRAGYLDDDYRRQIRARIVTNRSRGVPRDLIKIARLIIDDVDARMVIQNYGNAALELRVADAAVDPDLADLLLDFLIDGVAAGVRLVLKTSSDVPAAMFNFTDGPGVGFATRATLQLAEPNLNTKIGSRKQAAIGNAQTLALVSDAGAPNAGTLTDGAAAVFTFKPGTTTVANFETALASSEWLCVMTAGTADTLDAADAMTATLLTGGVAGGKFSSARST